MVVCQGGKPTLLTDIVDGELKRVRQDICDTSEQIAIYKQKLAAEKREGNKQLEDLLHSQYKLMNTLQELERTLLSSQAQSKPCQKKILVYLCSAHLALHSVTTCSTYVRTYALVHTVATV